MSTVAIAIYRESNTTELNPEIEKQEYKLKGRRQRCIPRMERHKTQADRASKSKENRMKQIKRESAKRMTRNWKWFVFIVHDTYNALETFDFQLSLSYNLLLFFYLFHYHYSFRYVIFCHTVYTQGVSADKCLCSCFGFVVARPFKYFNYVDLIYRWM